MVGASDIVYFIGDFAMAPKQHMKQDQYYLYKEMLDLLPGRKFLIRGNHDSLNVKNYLRMGFEEVHHVWYFKKQGLVLTHDPKVITQQYAPKGDLRWVVGHVHNNWTFRKNTRCLNVSVDAHDFYPVSWKDVCNFFKANVDISPQRC